MLSHGLRSSRVTKSSLKQIFQGKVEIDFSQQNSLKHHWCGPDVDCWLPSSLLIGPGHSWRSLVVCGHDTSLVCSHDVVFQWPSGVFPWRPRLVSNRDTCVSCWGLWVKFPVTKAQMPALCCVGGGAKIRGFVRHLFESMNSWA